jgi:hypothetical protein
VQPSKDRLNKAVLVVAGIDRDAAVRILARYGVTNTADLPRQHREAVFEEFEEAKARIDEAERRRRAS